VSTGEVQRMLALLIPLVLLDIGLIFLSRWSGLGKLERRLGHIVLWNLLIEIGARLLSYSGHSNLLLLHLYTLGEFLLFTRFYRALLPKRILGTRSYRGILAVGSLLIVANTIFLEGPFGFNSNAKTLVHLVILVYTMLYFAYFNFESSDQYRRLQPLLAINSAVLIYYAASLFIWMFTAYALTQGTPLPREFWLFNVSLNLLYQLVIFFALWKLLVHPSTYSSPSAS